MQPADSPEGNVVCLAEYTKYISSEFSWACAFVYCRLQCLQLFDPLDIARSLVRRAGAPFQLAQKQVHELFRHVRPTRSWRPKVQQNLGWGSWSTLHPVNVVLLGPLTPFDRTGGTPSFMLRAPCDDPLISSSATLSVAHSSNSCPDPGGQPARPTHLDMTIALPPPPTWLPAELSNRVTPHDQRLPLPNPPTWGTCGDLVSSTS